MNYNTLGFVKDEHIGIVTLLRANRMNALNMEFIREFDAVLDDVARDGETGALIITGNEKVFSAGADIKEVSEYKNPAEVHHFERAIQPLLQKIEDLEKPVIAAVSGLALGAGCELALACDLRIAARNAVFGQPEIKLGLIPGAGGSQRLPRIVGVTKAKEMLFLGDGIDASEALRVGLVNRVVETQALLEEAKLIAGKLARMPAMALRLCKKAVNIGMEVDLNAALAFEAQCFETLFSTDDEKEGMKAYLTKRMPYFKGS